MILTIWIGLNVWMSTQRGRHWMGRKSCLKRPPFIEAALMMAAASVIHHGRCYERWTEHRPMNPAQESHESPKPLNGLFITAQLFYYHFFYHYHYYYCCYYLVWMTRRLVSINLATLQPPLRSPGLTEQWHWLSSHWIHTDTEPRG